MDDLPQVALTPRRDGRCHFQAGVTHVSVSGTTTGMTAIPVKVGPKGRVVVPAAIRRELGIEEGTGLMARVGGERIILTPRAAALRRLQELVTSVVPRDRSLADELIAERREEARHEAEGD